MTRCCIFKNWAPLYTVLIVATLHLAPTEYVFAQPKVIVPGFAEQEYERFTWTFKKIDRLKFVTPSIDYSKRNTEDSAKTGFHLYPFRTATTWNSGYPRGFNDGAVWKGKGLTQEIHGGLSFTSKFVDIVFHPVVFYSQNRWFRYRQDTTLGTSPYSYPLFKLDQVTRFGDEPFVSFHPGQSDISVHAFNTRIGFSTQNVVVGPAYHYPILQSSQGPGFPHVYVTLDKPIDIIVGFVNARQFWGRIKESAYFDTNPANDNRYISGLSIGFRPHFLPNLNFGLNRVLHRQGENFKLNFSSIVAAFSPKIPTDGINQAVGNNYYDQLISLTSHYSLPDRGFELFWEYAKTDHGGLILGAPEDARAFIFGTTQTFILPGGEELGFHFEITDLSMNLMTFNRDGGGFYGHSIIEQGFTHQGQWIGAGIGQGSNSKKYKAHFNNGKWLHGLYFEMIQYDNDMFYRRFFRDPIGDDYRDTEHSYGYNLRHTNKKRSIEWSIIMAFRPTLFFEGHGWHYNLQNRLAITF